MPWDWKTNDPFKTCSFCGASVKHGIGWITIGMCEEHERIWKEDIASGFKQNRLREIMVERGEVVNNKTVNHE
jgi:hypothetical protein